MCVHCRCLCMKMLKCFFFFWFSGGSTTENGNTYQCSTNCAWQNFLFEQLLLLFEFDRVNGKLSKFVCNFFRLFTTALPRQSIYLYQKLFFSIKVFLKCFSKGFGPLSKNSSLELRHSQKYTYTKIWKEVDFN